MDPIVKGVILSSTILLLTILIGYFWTKSQFKRGILLTLILGLVLRIFGAASPYLHEWDERYHALVAKNLVEHPLSPTLHEHPVLAYDNQNWVGSNIWLAKPAFPLWLMSGSIALFGDNLVAIRLPSILLGLLAVWLTFLIARRLFGSKVALVAAYLHAIHGLTIELIGGGVSSDHVENTFIVMVELAIYFVVLQRGLKLQWRFTLLAGVFMGLAFLSKWYPAMIVLPVAVILLCGNKEVKIKDGLIHLMAMAMIAFIIAFPWTYYMYLTHPKEMGAILSGALSAYSNTVPSHDQVWYYYLNKVMVLFGELFYLVIIFAIYRGVKSKTYRRYSLIGLISWILIPLVLFSFAETKRFTYLLIASPAFFMLTAFFYVKVYDEYKSITKSIQFLLRGVILITIPILSLRYTAERMKIFKTVEQPRAECYEWPESEWKKLDEETIVFGSDDYVEIMFHSDVYAAYRKVPAAAVIDSLENQGYQVLIYKDFQFQ